MARTKRTTGTVSSFVWTEPMMKLLLSKWKEYSTDLKFQHNIYSYFAEIFKDFQLNGYKLVTTMDVKAKIDELIKNYREIDNIIKNHVGNHTFCDTKDEVPDSDENEASNEPPTKKIRLEESTLEVTALRKENLLIQKEMLKEQNETTKIQKEAAQMDLLIKKSQMDYEKERFKQLVNGNLNNNQIRPLVTLGNPQQTRLIVSQPPSQFQKKL